MKKVLKKLLHDKKSNFFFVLTKHKFFAVSFCSKGVVYRFNITKVCFIDRFSLKHETYFSEIERSLHQGALEKIAKFYIVFCDNIDVLRLIKWFISMKFLRSVTKYYCDNKIVCGAYSRCR